MSVCQREYRARRDGGPRTPCGSSATGNTSTTQSAGGAALSPSRAPERTAFLPCAPAVCGLMGPPGAAGSARRLARHTVEGARRCGRLRLTAGSAGGVRVAGPGPPVPARGRTVPAPATVATARRPPSCIRRRRQGLIRPRPPNIDYTDNVPYGASSFPSQVGAEGHGPPLGCLMTLCPGRSAVRWRSSTTTTSRARCWWRLPCHSWAGKQRQTGPA